MTGPTHADTQRMMTYDANKKSIAVAYLCWLLLGLCGAHRFYMGKWFTAMVMLAMTMFSFVMMLILVGYFTIAVPAIWALVDALLIPGWVRSHNNKLISELER